MSHSIQTIAVVGATGMLGQPVVEGLLRHGFKVVTIGRSLKKLNDLFGQGEVGQEEAVSSVVADVHDPQSLLDAFEGCDGIHVNLSGHSPKSTYENQVMGMRNIVQAAGARNIQRITFLSGTTTHPNHVWHYDTHAKWEAEKILSSSGIPYLVFCPSWFMESLPLFIQGKRATVFGPTTQAVHWVSAKDYSDIVAKSYQQEAVINQRLHVHGPEAWTIFEGVEKYVNSLSENITVGRLPYFMGSLFAWLSKDEVLKDAVALLKYYEKVGESSDPTLTNQTFGQPSMTIDSWIKLQAS